MTKLGKASVVLVAAATAVTAWIAIDLWRPVSSNLRAFDPEQVARLDTDMWRSYYDKERLLANGDRWEREIAKNISLDAPYR